MENLAIVEISRRNRNAHILSASVERRRVREQEEKLARSKFRQDMKSRMASTALCPGIKFIRTDVPAQTMQEALKLKMVTRQATLKKEIRTREMALKTWMKLYLTTPLRLLKVRAKEMLQKEEKSLADIRREIDSLNGVHYV